MSWVLTLVIPTASSKHEATGQGKNGLGERLYPQGDLQLPKQEDLCRWERRFVPLLACLLLGYIWVCSIFTAPGKVY